jgi:catechol 2,3-dioxygenase-like lactoylglutathione lyase family enzyme
VKPWSTPANSWWVTTMTRTFGLSHISLAVRDAEKSFRFYSHVFGREAIHRGPGTVQAQTPGRKESSSSTKPPHDRVNRGVSRISAFPYVYVSDPDGYGVEVWFE